MVHFDFVSLIKNHGLSLNEEQLNKLERFYYLLVETNKVMNLTAITDKSEVYEKHYYDSLLFSFGLDLNNKSLVDVGTGAGFPGLVLAICYPFLKVDLIEPLTKRCVFLENVKRELNLTNVSIFNMRCEEFAIHNREKYDYATARAVKRLNILLEMIIPILKVDGCFIALKGKQGEEEILESRNAFLILKSQVEKNEITKLVTNSDIRMNIFIRKKEKTPLKYPRNYSQISKKPL